jgi:hypothetical protein
MSVRKRRPRCMQVRLGKGKLGPCRLIALQTCWTCGKAFATTRHLRQRRSDCQSLGLRWICTTAHCHPSRSLTHPIATLGEPTGPLIPHRSRSTSPRGTALSEHGRMAPRWRFSRMAPRWRYGQTKQCCPHHLPVADPDMRMQQLMHRGISTIQVSVAMCCKQTVNNGSTMSMGSNRHKKCSTGLPQDTKR